MTPIIGDVKRQLFGPIFAFATLIEFKRADCDRFGSLKGKDVRIACGIALPSIVVICASIAVEYHDSASIIAFTNSFFVAETDELPCGWVGNRSGQFDARLHGLCLIVEDAFVHATVQAGNVDGIHPGHFAHQGSFTCVGTVALPHVSARLQIECLVVELCDTVPKVVARVACPLVLGVTESGMIQSIPLSCGC